MHLDSRNLQNHSAVLFYLGFVPVLSLASSPVSCTLCKPQTDSQTESTIPNTQSSFPVIFSPWQRCWSDSWSLYLPGSSFLPAAIRSSSWLLKGAFASSIPALLGCFAFSSDWSFRECSSEVLTCCCKGYANSLMSWLDDAWAGFHRCHKEHAGKVHVRSSDNSHSS